MCGLAGFIDTHLNKDEAKQVLHRMLGKIRHRGPDDFGIWQDGSLSLGHNRLSIIDLSHAGHQPMVSKCGRYVIAFNGEIYNHGTIRESLRKDGETFIGESDTEVLLALIVNLGLENALIKCVGMFAIALWDRQKCTLQLARDRFGEKPIFYGWHRGRFLFSSELKSLIHHPEFNQEIENESVYRQLELGYIPEPLTIYRNTWKLMHGSILSILLKSNPCGDLTTESASQSITQYWKHEAVILDGVVAPFKGTFQEASEHLEGVIEESVRLQLHADVPIGAFLSGGVDSSLIAALMQKNSSKNVKTFSIGFSDQHYDEAGHAKKVANYLGTDHHEFYVTGKDALDTVNEMPFIYDEPFSDRSQIPTLLLARFAGASVKVALSGDGGDEIFGGYQKYLIGKRHLNLPMKRAFARILGAIPKEQLDIFASKFGILKRYASSSRIETLLALLRINNAEEMIEYYSLVNRDAKRLMTKSSWQFKNKADEINILDYYTLAMLRDRNCFLPGNILVKVDRATMAASLESRAPFLDHRILEFVASLPVQYLISNNETKRLLKDVLYRHVSRKLVERPKSGFSVPLSQWLRSDLAEWASDLLNTDASIAPPYINLYRCRELFEQQKAGVRDVSPQLWNILMYANWYRKVFHESRIS